MKSAYILIALLLLGAWLLATGWTDSDWQLVSYRYSEWHRTIDFWEYNPFMRVNWWVAWQLNLLRICLGSGFLSVVAVEIWRRIKN